MRLDQMIRKEVRAWFPLQGPLISQLRREGLHDLLSLRIKAIEHAAEDLAKRAKAHEALISEIDDELTERMRLAEHEREKRAQPYPVITRGAAG